MRIVQIGLGKWGENNSKILSQLGFLSGVFDPNSDKAKEIGEKYSVKVYDSIDNLVSSDNFDAVFIDSTIPNSSELISNLLYSKKHVFAEKPISEYSELGKLHEITQKKKSLFSCSLDERYNSTLKQVKKLTKEKTFGEPIFLELYRESHLEKESLVFQSSFYDIDSANQIFGEMPVFVFSRIFSDEEEKFANIILGYPNNKSAVILSNYSSEKIAKLKVICLQKTIFADLESNKIEGFDENREENNPLLSQMENFISAIEGKNDLEVNANEIINLTKIAEGALLSSKQGVPIYLDLK
ncbi:MAG: Gfo/Idh/MocA family oxidoreductase [Nitrososphaeria archaeon]|nr:Gfo/Idh/MocA family oxidoreductase [Nitrosopumilaceae archaeon]NIP09319.1 Gfo/Idh/MocA family oxidoreductase [Nitrosopumilaceae archaeon]NIP91192.1 Gfo/Idh/MocA family oxidoreductase [Nitrososphaeria archaeon]NIS94486.1 Gfo/Idh/MocA family oxidoreductase [Nitrosopumilaceae archaeon]